jgi:prepilin-type processing-associated H-X9-DG protein
MPANYHNGGYSVAFADGHATIVRFLERSSTKKALSSLLPVVPDNYHLFQNGNYGGSPNFSGGHYQVISSKDYNTLDNETPFQ